MVIDKASWHARLYQWWHRRKHKREAGFVNLCPYVRVVLLWCWLRWLLRDGKIGRVPVPLLVWGFLLARLPFWVGVLSYELKMIVFVLYVYAAGLAVAIVIDDRWEARRKRLGRVPQESSFRRVLAERAKAMHDGICPVVEIR